MFTEIVGHSEGESRRVNSAGGLVRIVIMDLDHNERTVSPSTKRHSSLFGVVEGLNSDRLDHYNNNINVKLVLCQNTHLSSHSPCGNYFTTRFQRRRLLHAVSIVFRALGNVIDTHVDLHVMDKIRIAFSNLWPKSSYVILVVKVTFWELEKTTPVSCDLIRNMSIDRCDVDSLNSTVYSNIMLY